MWVLCQETASTRLAPERPIARPQNAGNIQTEEVNNADALYAKRYKKLIRRWDSERNFLYDDVVHALQNTIDSCFNSATDRRGYVLERMFTKFSKITQCNGHYAVQGHSRSPILVSIESSYTTSNFFTNLPPILHRFQVITDYSSHFR